MVDCIVSRSSLIACTAAEPANINFLLLKIFILFHFVSFHFLPKFRRFNTLWEGRVPELRQGLFQSSLLLSFLLISLEVSFLLCKYTCLLGVGTEVSNLRTLLFLLLFFILCVMGPISSPLHLTVDKEFDRLIWQIAYLSQ